MTSASEPRVFLRAASGLVKTAGPFDVFIYDIGLISIGIGICFTHQVGAASYPGGSIALASLIAAALMLFAAAAFWCWSITVPRSGGLYAYLTRGLSPSLGFAMSFVDALTWLFYNALAATYVTSIGLAPLFFATGAFLSRPRLIGLAQALNAPVTQFLVGAAAIVSAGFVLLLGMRWFFRLQRVMFAIATVGTVAAIYILATHDHNQFVLNFDRVVSPSTPGAYQRVLSKAAAHGWHSSNFSWPQTIKLAVWPILPLVGGIFSIAIGGEIREFKRSQAIGMLGSIAAAGVIFGVVGHLSDQIFGAKFQSALAFNAAVDPASSTPIRPYFPVLADILSGNAFWGILISLGFLAWAYLWIPATLVYSQRAMLAWSLDRLAPAQLGYVSDRFHTPAVAIVVTTILNILFLYLFLFARFFSALTPVLAAMIAWLFTMIAGIFFPFRRADLYGRSPSSEICSPGVPLLTFLSAMGLVSISILIYLLWNDPQAAGHSPPTLAVITIVFAMGFGFYFFMRQLRRRQGIDVSLAFREIPIE